LVVVTGPTGSGKSTLLRLLAGLLQRHGRGEASGKIEIDGKDPSEIAPHQRATALAYVTQSPGDQIVCRSLLDEVSFGLESTSCDPQTIESTALAWLQRVGLDYPPDLHPESLSGGEQQRLVIGASLAAGAKTVLLDEPLSQLDPKGAQAVIQMLKKMTQDGWAVVVVEHRIQELWDKADRFILMDEGTILFDNPVDSIPLTAFRRLGLSIPPIVDIRDRAELDGCQLKAVQPPSVDPNQTSGPGKLLLKTRAIEVSYTGRKERALETPVLAIDSGERLAILGHNGSGKSTLLRELSQIASEQSLSVAFVPQNADLTLFNSTVQGEIEFGPRERGSDALEQRVHDAVQALGLEDYRTRPPHSLSKGQRVRVAVASALACLPDLLLLDEPTAGQDAAQMHNTMRSIDPLLANRTLIFATHDVQLALSFSTRVIVLEEGQLIFDGPPDEAASVLNPVPPWVHFCHRHGLSVSTVDDAYRQLKCSTQD